MFKYSWAHIQESPKKVLISQLWLAVKFYESKKHIKAELCTGCVEGMPEHLHTESSKQGDLLLPHKEISDCSLTKE